MCWAKGERALLPGYRYLVVYKDLYSAYGGELDWFYGGRGVYTFSWAMDMSDVQQNRDEERSFNDPSYQFDRYLLFKKMHLLNGMNSTIHQYGKLRSEVLKRISGYYASRFPDGKYTPENMSFSIFHCFQTPKLSVDSVSEKDLGDGLRDHCRYQQRVPYSTYQPGSRNSK